MRFWATVMSMTLVLVVAVLSGSSAQEKKSPTNKEKIVGPAYPAFTALGSGAEGEEKPKVLSLNADNSLLAGGMAWSPDGKFLAIPVKKLVNADGKVIEPTPQNRTLKNARWKIGLRLWEVSTDRVQDKLGDPKVPIPNSRVILFPLDPSVMATDYSPLPKEPGFPFWNVADGSLRNVLPRLSDDALEFSPDGKTVAFWHRLGGSNPGSGSSLKSVPRLVDARTGKVLHDLKHVFSWRSIESSPSPMALAFSGDGKMLVTAEREQAILWSVSEGKKIRALANWEAKGETTGALGFSSGMLYRAGLGGITAWEVDTGKLKLHWEGFKTYFVPHGSPHTIFFNFTWNPTYPLVAVKSPDEIKVWDLTTRKLLHTFPTKNANAGLAFAADGRTLAVSDGEQTITVWQLEQLKEEKQN